MDTITVAQGRSLKFLVEIRDEADQPVRDSYTGIEPLALEIWPGGRRLAIALTASAVEWGGTGRDGTVYTPADGIVTVRIDDADTTTLDVGSYNLATTLTDGGEPYDFYLAVLRITGRPGTLAAPPVYGGFEEMAREAVWIDDLQDLDVNQTGFADQRAAARKWFDGLIQAHYRGGSAGAGRYLAGTLGTRYRSGRQNQWLQDHLDADHLVLTGPSGESIVRACSLFSLANVLRSQIGEFKGTSYQALAAQFAGMAEALAATIVAEIDVNGDGQGDIEIALGTVDVLRG